MGTVTRAALLGRWTHSHEDDTSDTRVYRPAAHPFPPARGRHSFEFAADGSMIDHGVGPTDRPVAQNGRWELTADDRLVLRTGAQNAERVLSIVAASPDRLVVKR